MKFKRVPNLTYPITLKKSKFPALVYIPMLAILLPAWVMFLLLVPRGVVPFLSFLFISWVVSFIAIPFIDIFWFRLTLDEDKMLYRSLLPLSSKKFKKQKFMPFIPLGRSSFQEHVITYKDVTSIELRRGESYRTDVAILHFYFGKEKPREFVLNENELNREALATLISAIAQKNNSVKLNNITLE